MKKTIDFVSHLFFSFTHISTNTLTLTSIERVIIIYCPLKCRSICTYQIAKRTILGLLLIFTVYEAQVFFIIGFKDGDGRLGCIAMSDFNLKVYQLSDSILYSYIPLIIMFLCNTAIIIKLILTKYQSIGASNNRNLSLTKATTRITIMLVSVSVLFITCTLPYAVVYQIDLDRSTYLYTIIIVLMYTNHSVNFIVYYATNNQFRKELHNMFCCKDQLTPGNTEESIT